MEVETQLKIHDRARRVQEKSLPSNSDGRKRGSGITQSVAAFCVSVQDSYATFIDTPGHAAFSAMRSKGTIATDVVILVVAADDGVMPQTEECIRLAREANVPVVVALNKCDLPGVDTDKVRAQLLSKCGIECEQIGGSVQCVEVSAKVSNGLSELLDAVRSTKIKNN